jgi:uncharacterized protein
MPPAPDPGGIAYLDSSAIVKLVIAEPESETLRRELADWPARASSAIGAVEVVRVARRHGAKAETVAAAVLARVTLVALDDRTIEIAGRVDPPGLRTLDALHVATALRFAGDIGAVFTYDVECRTRSRQPI